MIIAPIYIFSEVVDLDPVNVLTKDPNGPWLDVVDGVLENAPLAADSNSDPAVVLPSRSGAATLPPVGVLPGFTGLGTPGRFKTPVGCDRFTRPGDLMGS